MKMMIIKRKMKNKNKLKKLKKKINHNIYYY